MSRRNYANVKSSVKGLKRFARALNDGNLGRTPVPSSYSVGEGFVLEECLDNLIGLQCGANRRTRLVWRASPDFPVLVTVVVCEREVRSVMLIVVLADGGIEHAKTLGWKERGVPTSSRSSPMTGFSLCMRICLSERVGDKEVWLVSLRGYWWQC